MTTTDPVPPAIYDDDARWNQLSRPLRRRRRRGVLVGLVLGLVWSTCLMIILAQLGTSLVTFDLGWPWWAGLGSGMVFSAGLAAARSATRHLRIKLAATRVGLLSVAVLAASLSTLVVAGSGRPVLAQETAQGGPGGVDCPVAVSGLGVSGPAVFSDTTADDPLVVDLTLADEVLVEWRLPPGAEPRGRTWVVGIEIAGFDTRLATATADDDSGRYVIDGLTTDVAPGVYSVWGEFEPDADGNRICRRQFGYVRIVGSPLTNPVGLTALGGLVVGLGATVMWARRSRLDLWSLTSDAVTIEIVDPETGRRVRGALRRGARYNARITIEFPDPASAYVGVPGPVEAVVGVVGGTGGLGVAAMNPGGTVSAEVGFDIPATGTEPLQLNTDLTMGGNVIRSVRVVEQVVEPGLGAHRVHDAAGQVVYRGLDLTARELLSVRPVDAGLMIHGNRMGDRLELWGYQGDSANRTVFRSVIATADLALAAGEYRRCLEHSARGWLDESSTAVDPFAQKVFRGESTDDGDGEGDGQRGSGGVVDAELLALVAAGSSLRHRLLGGAPPLAPFDGTVSIAHDVDATDHMTFPWTGLYRGAAPGSSDRVVACPGWSDPGRCPAQGNDGNWLTTAHPPTTVCPYDFWGLRYELAWPDGWTPGVAKPSNGGRFRLFSRRRDWTVNLIDNELPVTMVSLVAQELLGLDPLGPLRQVGCVAERSVGTVDGFITALAQLHDRVELVYCTAHGGTTVAGDAGYALDLDRPLTGAALSPLGPGQRFEQGPLVIVNACESGVVGLTEDHPLLSVFRRLGARAVIVTEAPVRSDDAAAAVAAILDQSLRGNFVSRAVLNARRADYADNGKLSWLAYSYYGPSGLRFTNPVPIDLTTPGSPPPPSPPTWPAPSWPVPTWPAPASASAPGSAGDT